MSPFFVVAGFVSLRWDNSYSRMRSKTLHCVLLLLPPGSPDTLTLDVGRAAAAKCLADRREQRRAARRRRRRQSKAVTTDDVDVSVDAAAFDGGSSDDDDDSSDADSLTAGDDKDDDDDDDSDDMHEVATTTMPVHVVEDDAAMEARLRDLPQLASGCRWGLMKRSDYFKCAPAATTADCQPSVQAAIHPPPARETTRNIAGRVVMSDEFPFTPRQLLPVVQVLARTSQHFRNVEQFLETKLPPGFPVKFAVPVVPTVTATVEFGAVDVGGVTAADMEAPPDFVDVTGRMDAAEFFKAMGTVAKSTTKKK